MDEKTNRTEALQKERDKIKAETEKQILRSRINDYIAIVLALGAVFILWLLQLMGVY